MKYSDHEVFRFLVAGTANTVATYVLYLALLPVANYLFAYTVSYVAGIVGSFVLNSVYVFRQPLRWIRLLAYPVLNVVQYLVGIGVTWLLVERWGWPEEIAPAAAIVAGLPLAFYGNKLLLGKRIHGAAHD